MKSRTILAEARRNAKQCVAITWSATTIEAISRQSCSAAYGSPWSMAEMTRVTLDMQIIVPVNPERFVVFADGPVEVLLTTQEVAQTDAGQGEFRVEPERS